MCEVLNMEEIKCCFCGRKLPKAVQRNNPEPLCSDFGTVCCASCDKTLVIPTRRVLWRYWVDKEQEQKILAYFKSLPVEELRDILPQNSFMIDPAEWKEYIERLKNRGAEI